MNWMVVFPTLPNSYAEALIPNVTVFGGDAFGSELGVDIVMSVEAPVME